MQYMVYVVIMYIKFIKLKKKKRLIDGKDPKDILQEILDATDDNVKEQQEDAQIVLSSNASGEAGGKRKILVSLFFFSCFFSLNLACIKVIKSWSLHKNCINIYPPTERCLFFCVSFVFVWFL